MEKNSIHVPLVTKSSAGNGLNTTIYVTGTNEAGDLVAGSTVIGEFGGRLAAKRSERLLRQRANAKSKKKIKAC